MVLICGGLILADLGVIGLIGLAGVENVVCGLGLKMDLISCLPLLRCWESTLWDRIVSSAKV